MEILKILLEAFKEWVRDRAVSFAAALAYFELLCIGPVVGIIIFISDKILGKERLYSEVIPLLKSNVTPQLTKVIILFLSTERGIDTNELTTISVLSCLLLLWAGKEYFGQIKKTVEFTWNYRRDAFGITPKIKRTIKTLKIALVAIGIVILFLFIRALIPEPNILKENETAANFYYIKISQWIVGIFLISLIKIFYFTFIPPVKINWKYTIPGAVLNAVLFLIGKEFMEADFEERPNAEAGECVIMVLLWFYYSNLIFIYSAEFTRIYVAKKQEMDFTNMKTGY